MIRAVALKAQRWSSVSMGGARIEKAWRAKSGTLWFDIEQRPLVDRRQRSLGALIVLRDITARKRLEDDLRRESYSDHLTGLSNRRYFEDECARLRVI